MKPKVRRQRHLAIFDLLAHFFELLDLFLGVVSIKNTQVETAPTGVDVVSEKPTRRLNVCVPRIDRFVRVAIVAGTPQNQRDIRRNRKGGFERIALDDRRICSFYLKELYYDECSRKHKKKDLYRIFHPGYRTMQVGGGK